MLDFFGVFGESSSRGSVASNGIQTRMPTTWKWPPRLGDRCEILTSPPFPRETSSLGLTKSAPWIFRCVCVCVSYIENGGSFLHCHVFFGEREFGNFFILERGFLDSWRMFRSFSGSNHREIGISKSEGKILARIFQVTVSTFGRGKKRPNKKTNV